MAKVQYWFVHVWLYIYVYDTLKTLLSFVAPSCVSFMWLLVWKHIPDSDMKSSDSDYEIPWVKQWNELHQSWVLIIVQLFYAVRITWMLIVFLTTWSLFIVFTFLYTASCCLFYTSLLLSLSVCGIAFEIRKSNVRFLQLFQKVTLPTLIFYY